MSILAFSVMPIFIIFFLAIPIALGVYVYRDARKRGMNTVLWLAVVLLLPAFIGFILYLLARTGYSDLQCPKCGEKVEDSYASCPYCGTPFKAVCPVCSFPVEKDWKVCPHCASPLSVQTDELAAPVRKKDRALGKIIFAVLLVPLMLILFGVCSMSALQSAGSGGAGITSLPLSEYRDEINHTEIEQWLDERQPDSQKAYALCHTFEQSNGTQEFQYLVYMPQLTEQPDLTIHPSTGFFGNTLEIAVQANSESLPSGNTVLLISTSNPKLRLLYGGQEIECETDVVPFALELPPQ